MKKKLSDLIGRENELARFDESAKRAFAGQPTLLLYDGESGSGKTTLIEALQASHLLSPRRIRVLRLNAEDNAADTVRQAADRITHAKFFARFGGRSRAGSFIGKVLPEWIGAIPLIGNVLEAITVTIQAVRRRTRKESQQKFAEDISAVHTYAQHHAVALLVDDGQLMNDHAADRLLRLVAAAPEGARLLVVCAVHTPPPGSPQPPVRMLQHHVKEPRLVTHRLEAFSITEMHDWLNAKFHDARLPPPVINYLLAETGGQPGMVLRVIDELMHKGILRKTDDGWSYDSLADATWRPQTRPIHSSARCEPMWRTLFVPRACSVTNSTR